YSAEISGIYILAHRSFTSSTASSCALRLQPEGTRVASIQRPKNSLTPGARNRSFHPRSIIDRVVFPSDGAGVKEHCEYRQRRIIMNNANDRRGRGDDDRIKELSFEEEDNQPAK